MQIVILVVFIAAAPIVAEAQQYRNLEVTPNVSGGVSGTYGRQNFESPPDYNRPILRGSDRRFRETPPTIVIPNEGVTGNTQERCYTTGNGNAICR